MSGKQLFRYIEKLHAENEFITAERKLELERIAGVVRQELKENDICRLMAICTHNSRRSQLMEAWIIAAAQYFDINGIAASSGGTEATAFNIRMVLALRQVGFHLQENSSGDNPQYELTPLTSKAMGHAMFSKKYDDPFNPQEAYIALMVCDHADQNCPIIKGASHRISLPYLDPKEYDDSPMEHQMYMEKVDEIGREIIYLFDKVRA